MNDLPYQMESVPFSGQCDYGRQTYVELKLKDIEKLFGRKYYDRLDKSPWSR